MSGVSESLGNVVESPGLYLKLNCKCSSKIQKIQGNESFNVIQIISRISINCLKCGEEGREKGNLSVVIKGLNHKISYKEKVNGSQPVCNTVSMKANQIKSYSLNSYYSYFQIDII